MNADMYTHEFTRDEVLESAALANYGVCLQSVLHDVTSNVWAYLIFKAYCSICDVSKEHLKWLFCTAILFDQTNHKKVM